MVPARQLPIIQLTPHDEADIVAFMKLLARTSGQDGDCSRLARPHAIKLIEQIAVGSVMPR
jgi:hypothetical protein